MALNIVINTPPSPEVVTVMVPGMQGPSALSIGETNSLTPGRPGLWIETGLGANGRGITFWIEDGQ